MKCKKATEIKFKLDSVFGDSSSSLSTVNFSLSEFKHGCTSTDNEHRSARQKIGNCDKIVKKVHEMVDWRCVRYLKPLACQMKVYIEF